MAVLQYTVYEYLVSFRPDGSVVEEPTLHGRARGLDPTVIPWHCAEGTGLTIRVEASFPSDALEFARFVRRQYLEV